MPEEVKRKRGRPPKNKVSEVNTQTVQADAQPVKDETNEQNSYYANLAFDASNFLFSCGVYNYFTKSDIDNILRNPVMYHEEAIRLSDFVYTKNGIVSNSIDYMTSLPCLDRIIISPNSTAKTKKKKNRDLMKAALKTIDDKAFIRDALHTEMREGTAFYYFDIRQGTFDRNKFMTDYDVENIVEINEVGINARIVTLPWRYTKIVGKRNGRYVLAFNLRYFDDFTGEKLEQKLRKYPTEITDGYHKRHDGETTGDWMILDNTRTLCRKIKCKDSEPWGRSLIIAALEDVLYKDYYVDTKRKVLDDINSKIIYQTFPEGKDKGTCALTAKQQEKQHNDVKNAVMNKNTRGGISFFSVAAGTKLSSVDVDIDIFDSKNESNLNNDISQDLGICASLIGAMTTGNFAAGSHNLEMINAQLYTWVYEWQQELNYVINKNIIKDERNKVEVYYFPTSFVNKQTFFNFCKDLYMSAGGSLSFLIASAGIDPDAYFSVLDQEIEDDIFSRYKPHETSYTLSKNQEDSGSGTAASDGAGRPKLDNVTNENTIVSRNNGANDLPSPSDNK